MLMTARQHGLIDNRSSSCNTAHSADQILVVREPSTGKCEIQQLKSHQQLLSYEPSAWKHNYPAAIDETEERIIRRGARAAISTRRISLNYARLRTYDEPVG
eukprot:6172298-Pleurochrysis_carterae.AAC.1